MKIKNWISATGDLMLFGIFATKSYHQKHRRPISFAVVLITFLLSVTYVSAAGNLWILKSSDAINSVFGERSPNDASAPAYHSDRTNAGAFYLPTTGLWSQIYGAPIPVLGKMTVNAGATPQSAAVSTTFSHALAVTVRDASNNPVSG